MDLKYSTNGDYTVSTNDTVLTIAGIPNWPVGGFNFLNVTTVVGPTDYDNNNKLTSFLVMIELKFTAEKIDGQIVGGVIAADSVSSAKQKANLIAVQNNFRIKKLERKSTFVYKVSAG